MGTILTTILGTILGTIIGYVKMYYLGMLHALIDPSGDYFPYWNEIWNSIDEMISSFPIDDFIHGIWYEYYYMSTEG